MLLLFKRLIFKTGYVKIYTLRFHYVGIMWWYLIECSFEWENILTKRHMYFNQRHINVYWFFVVTKVKKNFIKKMPVIFMKFELSATATLFQKWNLIENFFGRSKANIAPTKFMYPIPSFVTFADTKFLSFYMYSFWNG